ncbi:MAG: hypothetical protein PHE33_04050 [Bacteroidales bacterium]|nr:hypothetical protein [Bacteroidales bacterium]
MSALKKIKKVEFLTKLSHEFDLFICSSSFDRRCISIPNIVSTKNFSNTRVCHFENNYECADNNYKEIIEILQNTSPNLETILLKKHDPLDNYDLINSSFSEIKFSENSHVLIDISTFTREILLIFIRFLTLNYNNKFSVTFCYSPSANYPAWLSKGVKEIRSILGYSGDYSPLKRDFLIILVGFEWERSQIVIDNYEPSKLFIGKADPSNSISEELGKINDNHFRNLLERNSLAEKFEFSCIDIENTKNIISEIALKYQNEYNIIVAPMSNKISTLGVAYAALENQNIQICYASTNQYNIDEEQSETDYVYCFNLYDYFKQR